MTSGEVANHNAAYLEVWNEKSRLSIGAKDSDYKPGGQTACGVIFRSVSFSEIAGSTQFVWVEGLGCFEQIS